MGWETNHIVVIAVEIFGDSVISRVAQPGGEAPHLEDNVWEWSTPSS